jgi:GNAT superfamily N-acetyltransferase
MSSNETIRLITTQETLPLRKKVLKPFLREEECVNPGDDNPSTFHIGLFKTGRLVCIATFLSEPHPEFSAGNPYRLRGMATDPEFQGQGLGSVLLTFGVEYLRTRRSDLLWFNAREKAFKFYGNLGFIIHGPLFEIKDIGPHKVMYKRILSK